MNAIPDDGDAEKVLDRIDYLVACHIFDGAIMACPVCDHTMHSLPSPEGVRQFWCPRCGCYKREYGAHSDPECPKWTRLIGGVSLYQWLLVMLNLAQNDTLGLTARLLVEEFTNARRGEIDEAVAMVKLHSTAEAKKLSLLPKDSP